MPGTSKLRRSHAVRGALFVLLVLAARGSVADAPARLIEGEPLPTGARITPTAAPGSRFVQLDPGLPTRPGFTVDHAVSAALSPDARTLLVLTSGYNLFNGPDGNPIPAASTEYVFVYDVTRVPAVQQQVLQVPNTFSGIAWSPGGREFYVSGGDDDNVHVFVQHGASFEESTPAISLGHLPNPPTSLGGLGLGVKPEAAGIAVTQDGTRAVVANFENDSATVIDLGKRKAIAEVLLRPGKIDPARAGTPGGEFPFWVAIRGNSKAYVSSERDGEVVVIDLTGAPRVLGHIPVGAQPNKMILDHSQRRLFVANGSSDSVSIIDIATDRVIEQIATTAPRELLGGAAKLLGSNPNSLALSPDERTLYATNGGTNSLAVIRLQGGDDRDEDDRDREDSSRVVGLIPTGWYPTAVAVADGGSRLFVVNAKSNTGPDPRNCRDTLSTDPAAEVPCNASNQYVWQTEKAGLLQLPTPRGAELARLTLQVAANNRFPAVAGEAAGREMMEFLRSRIHHVIYIVKENRTYDQVLGDLRPGNGDASLALFPEPISPNHHALARAFVTLDNFYDSGETSGVGWNWTTAGRTTDFIEKTQPVNYSGRGLTYDWEGTNRNINVGLATFAERLAANPLTPTDPDLLPGATDLSTAQNADGVTTYLWSNALRHGLSVRNYGFFGDLTRYFLPPGIPFAVPPDRNAFADGKVQFFPADKDLQSISDPFFRGFDMNLADFWRFKEWEREFDQFERDDNLPALTLLRLPHDHFGSFGSALDGVNTPDRQMADNDYAIGLVVEKVSHSRNADDTLIFIVEDDAQDGPDHVDAHRSLAYVLGANVRRGALVSERYDTVSMVRTIEDVLGLPPQGLTDGLAAPMALVFQREAKPWAYRAVVPDVLRKTALPLPPPAPGARSASLARPRHGAAWWARATAGMDFSREDALDSARFNLALWRGIKGERAPYPMARSAGVTLSGGMTVLEATP